MLFPKQSHLMLALLVLTVIAFGCKRNEDPILSRIFSESIIESNIVYYKSDSLELKLDVWRPIKRLGEPPWLGNKGKTTPVILNIHGGKWIYGDKVDDTFDMMHYMDRGWAVVNINYRYSNVAPLPMPILDCRRALNWIYQNADKYGFNTDKIIVSGASSGGHYALMTGLMNAKDDSEVLNVSFPYDLKVMAIINWYGMYDMGRVDKWDGTVLDWENEDFLHTLIGSPNNAQHILNITSPKNFIDESDPPIISIHGTSDPIVPYSQSENLHKHLGKMGIKNELVPIQDGKHHDFSPTELSMAYQKIFEFLDSIEK
ncbi:alpha/beta hydrolase [Muricauda sp. CAU 1633]|uniref:alpha/beta hydrolase n=1 Tax=Allomuricauda sp. CAU 1633 TaxID=2816036 RepID=UPI001A90042C|nr:alpha/beta hydrolase [Muricauda sp. CAU 1633]MBO0320773.1 alpha/beta hydrolase [Muricauda sp. CAU 1633]